MLPCTKGVVVFVWSWFRSDQEHLVSADFFLTHRIQSRIWSPTIIYEYQPMLTCSRASMLRARQIFGFIKEKEKFASNMTEVEPHGLQPFSRVRPSLKQTGRLRAKQKGDAEYSATLLMARSKGHLTMHSLHSLEIDLHPWGEWKLPGVYQNSHLHTGL